MEGFGADVGEGGGVGVEAGGGEVEAEVEEAGACGGGGEELQGGEDECAAGEASYCWGVSTYGGGGKWGGVRCSEMKCSVVAFSHMARYVSSG